VAAKNIKEAVEKWMENREAEGKKGKPLVSKEEFRDTLLAELRDYFAHAHYTHLNKLKKDKKPWETADYQIREFIDEVFEGVKAYRQ
jgi:hypothetical protein